MGTLVCFHAHPDDEAISTGGTMARAAAEGHRVVLVVATGGEWGERPDDLGADESLADRRRRETEESMRALGAHRTVWLGYEDSGMTGWEQNVRPTSFHQAPLAEAAIRLAKVLREERADVLTVYDWHGVYGHPDHIKVHRVGLRAAELAGSVRVLEATMNRNLIVELRRAARDAGDDQSGDDDFDPEAPADDGNPFGTPAHEITLAVDVSTHLAAKRAALGCHRSQISETSFFATMPEEVFAMAFGTEWFSEHGVAATGPRTDWIFPGKAGRAGS
ncbi:MAG: PIG-L deacetylase family protein [Ilumatobacteraceae bacterium]